MFSRSAKKLPKSVTILPDNQTLEVTHGQTILESAMDAGVDLPYSCGVGSCKSCMVLLEEGKVTSLVELDYILEPDEIEKNYILCCQSLVEEESVIRLLRDETV